MVLSLKQFSVHLARKTLTTQFAGVEPDKPPSAPAVGDNQVYY